MSMSIYILKINDKICAKYDNICQLKFIEKPYFFGVCAKSQWLKYIKKIFFIYKFLRFDLEK